MKKNNVIAVALLAGTGFLAGCAHEMQGDTFTSRKSNVDQQDVKTTPPANPNSVVEQPPAKAGTFTKRSNTGPEVDRKDDTMIAPPDTTVDPKKMEGFKNRQNKTNPM